MLLYNSPYSPYDCGYSRTVLKILNKVYSKKIAHQHKKDPARIKLLNKSIKALIESSPNSVINFIEPPLIMDSPFNPNFDAGSDGKRRRYVRILKKVTHKQSDFIIIIKIY